MTNNLIDDCRYCHFCGKNSHEVKKLIAGPQVFICDECISLCVGIIQKSDNTFFNKIRYELKGDKEMKIASMKSVDMPDEFWNLLDQANIYDRMTSAILLKDADLSDALCERAYGFSSKARTAESMAWKMAIDVHPEAKGKQMSASHGIRKVHIEQ